MPILQADLLRAAARKTYNFSTGYGKSKGFLCHSHQDRALAEGLQQLLAEQGLMLYIDWQDSAMPSEPNRQTAERIQTAIRESSIFIFLATENSTKSRWCPWEIGYADGCNKGDRIAVMQTKDSHGHFYGNEYLNLYRRIDHSPNSNSVRWFSAGGMVPREFYSF